MRPIRFGRVKYWACPRTLLTAWLRTPLTCALSIENEEQAEELARPLPDGFYKLARRFWPGPLTIIVKSASRLPLKVTANTGNVALRVPSAKIPLAVVQAAGIPITATSANLSGESECTTAEAVRDQLQDRIS